jgi:hypothetical protein
MGSRRLLGEDFHDVDLDSFRTSNARCAQTRSIVSARTVNAITAKALNVRDLDCA